MSTGAFDILDERGRQIRVEGRARLGDVGRQEELLTAAMAYFHHAVDQVCNSSLPPLPGDEDEVPPIWPWDEKWWKPTDPRRNLVKAGALIAAAIDALDANESEAR